MKLLLVEDHIEEKTLNSEKKHKFYETNPVDYEREMKNSTENSIYFATSPDER